MEAQPNNRNALLILLIGLLLGILIVPLIVLASDDFEGVHIYLPIVNGGNTIQNTDKVSTLSTHKASTSSTPIPLPTVLFTISTPVPFDQLPPCPDNLGAITPPPDFSATGGCRAISTNVTTSTGISIISLPAFTPESTTIQTETTVHP